MEIWANTNTGYRVPQLGVYGLGLWSYRRVQRFSVKARGLRVNMGCRVLGFRAYRVKVPVGLGLSVFLTVLNPKP